MIEDFNKLESDINSLKEYCLNDNGKQYNLQEATNLFANARRSLKEAEIQFRFNISKEGED